MLQILKKYYYYQKCQLFTVKIYLLDTDTQTDILPCQHGRAKTIRAQGAPTIYPQVCPPADKVICLCSSVCVERAQRAGGKFLYSGVAKCPVISVWND